MARLSQKEVAQIYRSMLGGGAGQAQHINTMAAIAMAESGGDPSAFNRNQNGSVDIGLWQINSIHWGTPVTYRSRLSGKNVTTKMTAQGAKDPYVNAAYARAIYMQRNSYSPWVAYTNGKYKEFLEAQPDTVNERIANRLGELPGVDTVRSFANATNSWQAWSKEALATVGIGVIALVMAVVGVIILTRKQTGNLAVGVASTAVKAVTKV